MRIFALSQNTVQKNGQVDIQQNPAVLRGLRLDSVFISSEITCTSEIDDLIAFLTHTRDCFRAGHADSSVIESVADEKAPLRNGLAD